MTEERKRILNMVKDGKLSVEEADELLATLALGPAEAVDEGPTGLVPGKKLKYLRIMVEPEGGNGKKERVNVRIPLSILRAGIKMTKLLPKEAREKIDGAFKEKGIGIDLDDITADNMEQLIASLIDMSVDVEAENKKVRIFCE